MSLIECDRVGCDVILCDRFSPKHGYICDPCFEELINLGVSTNVDVFMSSKKPMPNHNLDLAAIYFDGLFYTANE